MGLALRMVLYFISASMSGTGIEAVITVSQETGIITIDSLELIKMIGGLGGFIGTFVAGRFAKTNGGLT